MPTLERQQSGVNAVYVYIYEGKRERRREDGIRDQQNETGKIVRKRVNTKESKNTVEWRAREKLITDSSAKLQL
jgi:hypothetical protein